MSGQIYRFAGIEVDTSQGCVRCNGGERHLRQQTFQVLVYLLEQRQRLVTKEELLQTIWNGTAVTDDALVQCVMDIRRALGDDSRRPRFIKTVPRLGYRFIGEFEPATEPAGLNGREVAAPTKAGSPVDTPTLDGFVVSEKKSRRENYPAGRRGRVILVILGLLVFGLALGLYFRQRSTAHQLREITLTTAAGKKSL